MKSLWRQCRLGDLFQIKHGYAFKGKHFGTEGSHIVLTPGNFYDEGGFKKKGEKEKWYSGDVPDDYILSRGDLIVAMTEQAEGLLGSSALIPEDGLYLHNQRLGLIKDPKDADKRFLYYLFNSAPVRQQIRASCSGVKVRHTSPSRIYEVKVSVPDLPTQRKIAGILSAYDDLIENNVRRIRILEEMAQSLYREWFVHFRFPGHESTPLVDSPLGPIPEGWEVRKFSEVCSVITRGVTPQYEDGSGRFAINQKANTGSEIRIEYLKEIRQDLDVPEPKFARVGDLLINCLGEGTIGRVHYFLGPDREWAVDQHMSICRADDPHSSKLLFFYLDSPEGQAKIASVKSGGTNMTTFNISDLRSITVVWPTPSLLDFFGDKVKSLFALKATLQRRNQTLRQTRDLLLPKLLSGQMAVPVSDSVTVERSAPARALRPPSPGQAKEKTVSLPAAATPPVIPKAPRPTPPDAATTAAPDSPPSIDEITRRNVICAIRKLFSDGWWRDRETTLKELSQALGYRRLGPHIRGVLSTDLLTAVRRGILTSEGGGYALGFRTLTELPRDVLKDRFFTAIGRNWITRDDAIRTFARSLGFARTGDQIDKTARSLINGLIREGRLESDGGECIRRT